MAKKRAEKPEVEEQGGSPAGAAGALTDEQKRIAESRKSLEEPLSEGQRYFESPEGYIVVAEADRPHVWCRQANHGRGMLINPRR